MVSNKMTVRVLLLCLLAALNCEKKAPIENIKEDELVQCEKDGVITINVITAYDDADNLPIIRVLDSLQVSEVENSVLINNAVFYEQSHTDGSTVSFYGDFSGMADSVIVWRKAERHYKGNISPVYDTFILRANHQISIYPQTGSASIDKKSDVFVFSIDDDSLHSGFGIIVFEFIGADTVAIDAEINTVILPPNLPHIEVERPDSCLMEVQFSSIDKESYANLQDGAICFVEYSFQGRRKIECFSSFTDYSIFVDKGTSFSLWGFAPNFQKKGD